MLSPLFLLATAHGAEFGAGVYVGHLATQEDDFASPGFADGVRLRYKWNRNWGVEGAGGAAGNGLDLGLEGAHWFGGPGDTVIPFAAVGGGAYLGVRESGWFGSAGFGLDAEVFPIMDLRADARYRVIGTSILSNGFMFTTGIQFHNPRFHDADGDGIRDKIDGCRTEAEDADGFQDEDGCPDPDNDGDGVNDPTDKCVSQPEDKDGFQDEDGCPDPDNDGDGVADADDKCPLKAEDKDGFEDADGCPEDDNDKDGIPDARDKAPNEPETMNGYKDEDGVPDEVPAEVKKFSGRIEGIKFKTNSAELLPASRPVLDAAVAVLKQFPEVRLEVQGHTDDVGDDARNLKLSQDRAQSVVDYMTAAGVDKARLIARGYGETRPQVPNDSKANQALNRRVEFMLIGEGYSPPPPPPSKADGPKVPPPAKKVEDKPAAPAAPPPPAPKAEEKPAEPTAPPPPAPK
jgi:outer membrane protein OmpA-like peptidoglycan-associated protein